jgi:phage antirepressor YoqD-like protein
MENNKIQAYGYTSDDEVIENHKKKLSKVVTIFYTVSAVSYKTGIGRNKIYSLLRESKYLNEDNIPCQNYVDEGYFTYYVLLVKQKFKGILSISPKGINLILNLYKNHN